MLLREQTNNREAFERPVMRTAGRRNCPARRGFTLLEMLLAVVLVLMLASALVFNFSALLRGNRLEEGTNRLETLMRFARAQAANSGRKVQLVFSGGESTNTPAATTGEVRATWEPDPLRQPGCFADLAEAQWHVQEINDLVQVESVKLLDANTGCPSTDSADQEFDDEAGSTPAGSKPMAPITFYPDGSSDSAEIIVAARSAEEDQRMAVRLVGITGSISHQLLAADTEETLGESGLPERTPQMRREPVVRNTGTEQETTPRLLSTRPAPGDSSSRAVPTAPRSTVGETNSVDRSE
jgi:prepilin-type N-terminal cleavage/methylation domain-containing protein